MPSLENMQAFSKLLPGHSLHQLLVRGARCRFTVRSPGLINAELCVLRHEQERFEKATMLDSLYFLCQLRDMKVTECPREPRVKARGPEMAWYVLVPLAGTCQAGR